MKNHRRSRVRLTKNKTPSLARFYFTRHTLPRYLLPTTPQSTAMQGLANSVHNTGGLTSRRSPGVVEWILPDSSVQFQANGATSVRRCRISGKMLVIDSAAAWG